MAYLGFPSHLVKSVVCQVDGGTLCPQMVESEYLWNSSVKCLTCDQVYVIQEGILIMKLNQDALPTDLRTELEIRNREAKNYDQRLESRYYKEVLPTLKLLGNYRNKKVIEYGCGTGRFTSLLVNTAELLAVDFSEESLRVLANKIPIGMQVGLVLADAIKFVSADSYFDLALSFQFIEHIPGYEQRKIFFSNISKTLKPYDGRFIISGYHHDIRRRYYKLPQEGYHTGGIFYHFFLTKELQCEIENHLCVQSVKLIDITLPLEIRLSLPARIGGFVSSVISHIPGIRHFAHIVVVCGSNKID